MIFMVKNNTETEKKYLVKYLPTDLCAYAHSMIEQSYISFGDTPNGVEKRLRLMRSGDEEKYFYTEKSNDTISRMEYEAEITKEEYGRLSSCIISNPIIKTRYRLPLNDGLTAELDIYHGELSGLIIVEVEFSSLGDALCFLPPQWFGEDVTENNAYKNKNLAKKISST